MRFYIQPKHYISFRRKRRATKEKKNSKAIMRQPLFAKLKRASNQLLGSPKETRLICQLAAAAQLNRFGAGQAIVPASEGAAEGRLKGSLKAGATASAIVKRLKRLPPPLVDGSIKARSAPKTRTSGAICYCAPMMRFDCLLAII